MHGYFSGVLSTRPQQTIAMRIALVSEHASPLAALGGVTGRPERPRRRAAAGLSGWATMSPSTPAATTRSWPTVAVADGYEVVHLAAGPASRLPKDELLPHMADLRP